MVSFAKFSLQEVQNHNSNRIIIIIRQKNVVSINVVKAKSYCGRERDFAHNIYNEIVTNPRSTNYIRVPKHM